ncbi:MAG: CorA family divalent cation transporter [Candidatus Aminicenantales bacterium]
MNTIETWRAMLSGLLDTYLSSLFNGMNEIMKLLTIMVTVFIPLTFIADIYGMNFEFMSELKWRRGYFACLGVTPGCALWMVFYFRGK